MMIIKLYDNERYEYPFEKYEYPLIEINDDEKDLQQFKNDLKEYKKSDDYNIDDFLEFISTKEYFIRAIYYNTEIYF